jgi:hypothetical protein
MTVNEGEAFVAGDDSETAKSLLEAAEKAGLDPSVVRTAPGEGGFIVPAELAPKSKGKSDKPAPKSTDKK